ncbi:uncharacterized protein LOC143050900 [Mytilus galloprovincialis]|uniref:uncharacterized protein LOC143050900 n=1 Tax=Mytilus galloprovincialis TaxID=29158 RepID=UPI003F7CBFE7
MEVTKRKPNWSESELFALSATVNSTIDIIRGQFGPSLTSHDKTVIQFKSLIIFIICIMYSVNAVNASSVIRSVADCKKKWQDVKSVTKKKEATRVTETRVTEGGPTPVCSFKPWETNVLQCLTRTQVEGI